MKVSSKSFFIFSFLCCVLNSSLSAVGQKLVNPSKYSLRTVTKRCYGLVPTYQDRVVDRFRRVVLRKTHELNSTMLRKQEMDGFPLCHFPYPLKHSPMQSKVITNGEGRRLSEWCPQESDFLLCLALKQAFKGNAFFQKIQPKKELEDGKMHPETYCHGSLALVNSSGTTLVAGFHNPLISGPRDWVWLSNEKLHQNIIRNLTTHLVNDLHYLRDDNQFCLFPMSALRVPRVIIENSLERAQFETCFMMTPFNNNCLTKILYSLLVIGQDAVKSYHSGRLEVSKKELDLFLGQIFCAAKIITTPHYLGTLNNKWVLRQLEQFLDYMEARKLLIDPY